MRIKFWGVRGSTPTPQSSHLAYGGNTSCVEVRLRDDAVLILDGGTGVRNLGQALAEEFQSRSLHVHFLLTHFHWDHIQGIPFFLPLYNPAQRVTFYASAKLGRLQEMLQGQMSRPYFPVDLEATPRHEFIEFDTKVLRLGGACVHCFPLNHPQGAYGYRIETPQATVVFATDLEHGNPRLDSILVEHARQADLLIYDSQYTPEEYAGHAGWGHSTWLEATCVARRAGVKQLILFHHDPWHEDRLLADIAGQAATHFENTLGAAEGWSAEF